MSEVKFYNIEIHIDDSSPSSSIYVSYKGKIAWYNFQKLEFEYASIPKDQQRLVAYWAKIHRNELIEHYKYIKKVKPLANIENVCKMKEIHIDPLSPTDKLGLIFVWYQSDYKLIIWFSNLERRIVDMKEIINSSNENFKSLLDINFYEQYIVKPYKISWSKGLEVSANQLYSISKVLPSNIDFTKLDRSIIDDIIEEQQKIIKKNNTSLESCTNSCWKIILFPITIPMRIMHFLLKKAFF